MIKRYFERKIRENEQRAHAEAEARAKGEEVEEASKNTKPEAVMVEVNGRKIVVVGAGQHFRQDLIDIAKKRGEREMFDKSPAPKYRHPMATMHEMVDKWKRQQVGKKTMVYGPNNQMLKEINNDH